MLLPISVEPDAAVDNANVDSISTLIADLSLPSARSSDDGNGTQQAAPRSPAHDLQSSPTKFRTVKKQLRHERKSPVRSIAAETPPPLTFLAGIDQTPINVPMSKEDQIGRASRRERVCK